MSQIEQNTEMTRAELTAIRLARRYLKRNDGVLARVLNSYHSAAANGTQLGYLPDR